MNRKKTPLIIAAVLALLLSGAYVLYNNLSDDREMDRLAIKNEENQGEDREENNQMENNQEAEKTAAPDFVVYDGSGNQVSLSDFKGKPVILNFWASWCGPCKMEMPDFDEVYKQYGRDIHFLMVNLTDGRQETVALATEFLEKRDYSFPVYFDKDSDAATTYGVYSIPTTYFIDAEGNFVAQGNGALDKDTLLKGIELIMP